MLSVISLLWSVFPLRPSRFLSLLILVSIVGCVGSRSLEKPDPTEKIVIIGEYESIDLPFSIVERSRIGSRAKPKYNFADCILKAKARALVVGANAVKINTVWRQISLARHIEKCALDVSYLLISDDLSDNPSDELSLLVPPDKVLIHAEFIGRDILSPRTLGRSDNLIFFNEYQAMQVDLERVKDGKVQVHSPSKNGFRSNEVTEYDTSSAIAVYGKDMKLLHGRAPFQVRDIYSLKLGFRKKGHFGSIIEMFIPHGSSSYMLLDTCKYELRFAAIYDNHSRLSYFDVRPGVSLDFRKSGLISVGAFEWMPRSSKGDNIVASTSYPQMPIWGEDAALLAVLTALHPQIGVQFLVTGLIDGLFEHELVLKTSSSSISGCESFHDFSPVLLEVLSKK